MTIELASAEVLFIHKKDCQMLNNRMKLESKKNAEKIRITSKEIAQEILNNELEPTLVYAALEFVYKEQTALTDELLTKGIVRTIENARDWWLGIRNYWCKGKPKEYYVQLIQHLQSNIFRLPFLYKKLNFIISEVIETLRIVGIDIIISGLDLTDLTREYKKSDEFIQNWITHIKEMDWSRKQMVANKLEPLEIKFPRNNRKGISIFVKRPFYLIKKLTGLLGLYWKAGKNKGSNAEAHHKLTIESYAKREKIHKGNPGVYKITCIPTGEFYIGSSHDIDNRIQQHFNELKYSIHGNSHFQALWDKYGDITKGLNEGNFIWQIEDGETQDYRTRENELIEILKPQINSNFKKNLKIPTNLWERIRSISIRLNKHSDESDKKTKDFALILLEERIKQIEIEQGESEDT